MRRLDPKPGELLDRGRRISFRFDGKTCEAHPGDTVASALLASGVSIFSRSFKYHRPRGLLCVSGNCPNCLMNVNGTPNVRTCMQPVQDGDEVKSQHCWPSPRWDLLSLIERLDALMPVGFYYKTLIRPRLMWRLAEPVIRRLAGLGSLNHSNGKPPHYEHQHRHTEVAVAGGGAAGMAAALAAADSGAQVVLVESESELGGRLRSRSGQVVDPDTGASLAGFELARTWSRKVLDHPGIRVLTGSLAFGAYEGRLLSIARGDRLIHLRYGQLVAATGNHEYPLLFAGNDLPGVMLGSGVRKLLNLYRVRPGTRAAVVVSDDEGLELALELHDAGVELSVVVDRRSDPSASPSAGRLADLGVHHLRASHPVAAQGKRKVEALRVAVGPAGGVSNRHRVATYKCDLVCLCSPWSPAIELPRQEGGKARFDACSNQHVCASLPAHVHAAGHLEGTRDLPSLLRQGRTAGLRAAAAVRPLDGPAARRLERLDRLDRQQREESRSGKAREEIPFPRQSPGGEKAFVCLCEDVTDKDVANAVREGFREMELLKRYTTATMGPCQGKMCQMLLAGACARETGRTLHETGRTTSRPPVAPVSLGILAGPHHHPVKLTPLHGRHQASGAEQMAMGEWMRPFSYGNPEQEWRAVRERVGVIDVSTLGKLEVQGRDAGKLLDLVYTHHFSNLKPGRIRYGVLCGEDGIILDDGTVSRLAEDHFYITTTTGNISFVEQWMDWWAVVSGFCAHVTEITAHFAAVNLAGPRARTVLSRLTGLDLSNQAFRYMRCRTATVAGVPARLLRIGFVGETGWEIHVPASYGAYLWDTLLEAGADQGIAPFGVEAQRILRLEKKHFIVGQDTDALSNPIESNMGWVVKMDKPDFIGRQALRKAMKEGAHNRLVGFVTSRRVREGTAVVRDRQPVGRVTSARWIPHQDRCIGLAWVPEEDAADGSPILISHEGSLLPGRVHAAPFYDPKGAKLRS
ncbi:MAG: 2Fe-2S iron-sulfur cluster-binding protein [Candidatus Aminicenantes bacterium]|nr:2Fe-2S iron-sulfur cluster-binding protein [Candidatus Aminicenantes bacterium]